MKKLFYGFLIFICSFGIGYYYSSIWKSQKEGSVADSIINVNEINELKNENTIEASQTEEKVSYNASFALKQYYDECGHFSFKYSELPKELINLTKKEVEDLYKDWNVEEFSSNSLVLSQEVNNICDEHYIVKMGENNVEIYKIGNGGSLTLYKETDISKEYLPSEDIKTLEEGIAVYGNGKLNATIEDFE